MHAITAMDRFFHNASFSFPFGSLIWVERIKNWRNWWPDCEVVILTASVDTNTYKHMHRGGFTNQFTWLAINHLISINDRKLEIEVWCFLLAKISQLTILEKVACVISFSYPYWPVIFLIYTWEYHRYRDGSHEIGKSDKHALHTGTISMTKTGDKKTRRTDLWPSVSLMALLFVRPGVWDGVWLWCWISNDMSCSNGNFVWICRNGTSGWW